MASASFPQVGDVCSSLDHARRAIYRAAEQGGHRFSTIKSSTAYRHLDVRCPLAGSGNNRCSAKIFIRRRLGSSSAVEVSESCEKHTCRSSKREKDLKAARGFAREKLLKLNAPSPPPSTSRRPTQSDSDSESSAAVSNAGVEVVVTSNGLVGVKSSSKRRHRSERDVELDEQAGRRKARVSDSEDSETDAVSERRAGRRGTVGTRPLDKTSFRTSFFAPDDLNAAGPSQTFAPSADVSALEFSPLLSLTSPDSLFLLLLGTFPSVPSSDLTLFSSCLTSLDVTTAADVLLLVFIEEDLLVHLIDDAKEKQGMTAESTQTVVRMVELRESVRASME